MLTETDGVEEGADEDDGTGGNGRDREGEVEGWEYARDAANGDADVTGEVDDNARL